MMIEIQIILTIKKANYSKTNSTKILIMKMMRLKMKMVIKEMSMMYLVNNCNTLKMV